jgi:hypothetical protein
MHARSCCSSCIQPCAVYPDDAQQPEDVSRATTKDADATLGLRLQCIACQLSQTQRKGDILNTVDIMPAQGFDRGLFGLLTRSLGRGGRRGATLTLGVALGGGMAAAEERQSNEELVYRPMPTLMMVELVLN